MIRLSQLLLIALLLWACATPGQSSTAPAPQPGAPPLVDGVILGDGTPAALPEVAARRAALAAALAAPPFILALPDLDSSLAAAQRAVLADARVQAATRTADGGRLRAEVMAVAPASAGDLPAALAPRCPPGACARVQLYVYPTDTTVTAIAAGDAVLDMQLLPGAQPEIPAALAELAVAIARADPRLAAAFDGLAPSAAMALMSATKTSLERTSCERRRHLCVAPVFSWGDAALWTIVDLTDFSLVAATTWTEQGASGRRRVASEATLQDAALAPLCETPQLLERDGWRLSYRLTSSDGLELRDVSFQGQALVESLKVVDWHVGYAGRDGRRVGFSDAVGCPAFSSAAVIPYGPPTVEPEPGGGFTLRILFRSPNWPQPCNYQYSFVARFGADGSLAALAGNEGRGCGTEGLYHPVIRLAPAASALGLSDGRGRTPLAHEGMADWPAGDLRRILAAGDRGSFTIAPLWGDAAGAYLYWSEWRAAEGAGDLPSIGTCCAQDAAQGPEQFIDRLAPEALTRPVLWIVPRIPNAERARCWADSAVQDGMLVAQIWPCAAGVVILQGETSDVPTVEAGPTPPAP